MFQLFEPFMKLSTLRSVRLIGTLAVLAVVSACSTPEGLINKTKLDGKEYTNTCDGFKAEVAAIMDANNNPTALVVAENDNSQFDYLYLEPGQFVQRGDTLYFRLINDLEYGKYLQKGVAVQIKGSFSSQDHLTDIESEATGNLSTLIVDQKYYQANRSPYFVYKMPVGSSINGKQISLSFSVVQYDSKGNVKKVFCGTDVTPLGPIEPPCCTDRPAETARPRSIVQLPNVDIRNENYRYKGFVGTQDLIHPMSQTKFDRKLIVEVIKEYLGKYEAEGFQVKSIGLTGWASQGGKVELNQKLSDARAQAVTDELKKEFTAVGKYADVPITGAGRGEDWDRFDLLVKTATFSEEERQAILAISSGSDDMDQKEASLRKLPKKTWKKLIDEVLTLCRHTFIQYEFNYTGGTLAADQYPTQIPVISPELYNVATQQRSVGRYAPGGDVVSGLATLNNLIEANGNRTANLYAMRSTYQQAARDLKSAIADLERAQQAEPNNAQYAVAMLAYKTDYAYNYLISDRMKLLSSYNDFVARYPTDRVLLYNRAVLMDRVGFITGALAEYDKLLTGSNKSAIGLNNRGVARLKTNRIVEAESDFKEALSLDARLAEAHFNLGVVAAYKGLTDQAVGHLDQALAIAPDLRKDIASNPVFRVVRDTPKFAKYK
jgi:tetratricopeptide (TPR) repeat protein